MQVCLISPLTITDFGDPELTKEASPIERRVPLGVLSLAAILAKNGISSDIIVLDQLFIEFLSQTKSQNKGDFLTFAVRHLASRTFDVLGFGTICSSYALTLRMARAIKELYPNTPIMLGGPQASVVDVPTMANFPFIDFIIRREADDTLPALLATLGNANFRGLENLKGITFRLMGEVVRNPDAPIIADLDRLPLPAFHLLPAMERRTTIPLEIGRGCPFGCTFCSTSKFFGRRFRLKSPERVIEHMLFVKETYGIDNFSFIHDMFTANRKSVVRFCEVLLAHGKKFEWSCSARADCIDDELIALMAKAGCSGIFLGIETGSARLQRVIKKNLNLSETVKRIKSATQHRMSTAVALITGFPDETKQDLRDTLHFYIDSLRFDYAEPQLSLLAPIAETSLHTQYRDKLVLDYIFSDVSYQGLQMDPADLDMIKSYPQIFPNFYSIPTSELNRKYFQEIERFITYISLSLRWLVVMLFHDSGDFLEVFDRWMTWKRDRYSGDKALDDVKAPYYNRDTFPKDFLEFVRNYYLEEMDRASIVISAFIESEGILKPHKSERQLRNIEEQEDFTSTAYPYQATGVWLSQFNVDYQELLRCLRNKESLERVPLRKVTVGFQRIHKELIKVHQLSPLLAELWQMCSGTQTVKDIIQQFSVMEAKFENVPPYKACYYGLRLLKEQELIGISARPVS